MKKNEGFFEFFSSLSPGKKFLTILFCPCVGVYYILYNMIVKFFEGLEYISNHCFIPLLNQIGRCCSFVCDQISVVLNFISDCISAICTKIIDVLDYIIDIVLNLIRPFCSRILNLIENCLTFVNNCINQICVCLLNCCESIFRCVFDFLTKFMNFLWENCCQYIYRFITNIVSNVCRFLKFVIFEPIQKLLSFFWKYTEKFFTFIYHNIIKTIFNLIFKPIYNLFKDYLFIPIFRVVKSLFKFFGNLFEGVFQLIKSVFDPIKQLVASLFLILFKRNNNKTSRVIKPKTKERGGIDDSDIESGGEKIFCLKNSDLEHEYEIRKNKVTE